MSFRSIEFLIQEAFTGIRRNGLMAFASITTIALSLGVLGAFVLLALGANHFAASQLNEFEIAVFVLPRAGKPGAELVADKIARMKYVETVEVKDRDEEWARFKRERPDIQAAGLPINPLTYRLQVRVSEPDRTSAIAAQIRTLPNVDKVNEGRDVLAKVIAITRFLRIVSVIGALALLVTAVFIISNAIRLTLYARRREIRIMQLVGATNWFIKIPLVIEGIVFGALGALMAVLLLRLGSHYTSGFATRFARFLAEFRSGIDAVQLGALLVSLGAVIGALGSYMSIRRFLHD